MLYAEARVPECGRLDIEDIVLTARTGQIRLHGKGDQVRTVPLPAPARQALAAWSDERGTPRRAGVDRAARPDDRLGDHPGRSGRR